MKAWKVQKIFGDVVYDLRNKGLLPVVILLLVAIVAVPVLISRGGSSSSGTLQPTAGKAPLSTPETESAVVSYNPGVRDYKKRLDDLSAKNPFHQEFAKSAAEASQLNSTVATSSSTGSAGGGSTDATAPAESGGSGGSGGSGAGSTGDKKKKKQKVVTSYQVNLLAGDVESTLTPFENVPAMTPLPSQDAPAVLFYGLTGDHKQVQFLVSNRVGTLNGPGTCVPAPDDCALLTLGPGQSEDLLYTGNGKTYRIVVAEIKRFTK
jgi:hypothetical protein